MRRFQLSIVFAALLLPGAMFAQLYTPPGYGSGATAQGTSLGADIGYKTLNDDVYITFAPLIELPFLFDIKVGVTIPLEVLVLDRAPKGEAKVPSVRTGTYDDASDYLQLIKYVRRGTHLYYNPGDPFNWSFFYGQMTDGYIGHRTIVYRYNSNYDPTVFKPGLMADINNDWGGVEAFMSDVYRKEAVAGRGYIRPVGIVTGVHDLIWAHADFTPTQVATSITENRDPRRNGGVFFQEPEANRMIDPGRGGRLQQHIYPTMRDSLDEGGKTTPNNVNRPIEFEKYTDPVTGEEQIRAVPAESPLVPPDPQKDDKNNKASKWSPSFWNRWAVGYTVARDKDAPLTLEKDGSGNLVVDPDDLRPRAGTAASLTIVGMDTEFRLSPFSWLEVTPYVDMNKFKDIENSKGLHGGINFEFRPMETLKLYFRPEYREMSSNYLPTYFDQYYSIERTALQPRGVSDFSGLSSATSGTKLAYLQSLPSDGPKVRGYFGQLMMDWLQTVVVEGTYEDYTGPDNSKIFVGFYVPNVASFFMDGYYTKQGFNSYKESFRYDDRSLAAAELGYSIFAGLYVKVSFKRTWVYDQTTSTYKANDETTYSGGFNTSF